MKKIILFVFIFLIGCLSTGSIQSYRQGIREYNRDYEVIRIMPDDKYVVVKDDKGNIKVIALDKRTKRVKNEYFLKGE